MSLLKKILLWTENLPLWQRDACRRLFQKESLLSETDFNELYALMKSEHGIETRDDVESKPLTEEHLPQQNYFWTVLIFSG